VDTLDYIWVGRILITPPSIHRKKLGTMITERKMQLERREKKQRRKRGEKNTLLSQPSILVWKWASF